MSVITPDSFLDNDPTIPIPLQYQSSPSSSSSSSSSSLNKENDDGRHSNHNHPLSSFIQQHNFWQSFDDIGLSEIANDVLLLPSQSPLKHRYMSSINDNASFVQSPYKHGMKSSQVSKPAAHTHTLLTSPLAHNNANSISSPTPRRSNTSSSLSGMTPTPLFSHNKPLERSVTSNKRLFSSSGSLQEHENDEMENDSVSVSVSNTGTPHKRQKSNGYRSDGEGVPNDITMTQDDTIISTVYDSPVRAFSGSLSPNPHSLSTLGSEPSSSSHLSPFRRMASPYRLSSVSMFRNGGLNSMMIQHKSNTNNAASLPPSQVTHYLASGIKPRLTPSSYGNSKHLQSSNPTLVHSVPPPRATVTPATLAPSSSSSSSLSHSSTPMHAIPLSPTSSGITIKKEPISASKTNPSLSTSTTTTEAIPISSPPPDSLTLATEQLEHEVFGDSQRIGHLTSTVKAEKDGSDIEDEDDDESTSMSMATASPPTSSTSFHTNSTARKRSVGKEKAATSHTALPAPAKKGKSARLPKGLRHFSIKVCQKVEEQQITTYNTVADDLVRELARKNEHHDTSTDKKSSSKQSKGTGGAASGEEKQYDEKNIRRRVYDALNVLMAMGIIMKDKKTITWIGLPSNVQHNVNNFRYRKGEREKIIQDKKQDLADYCIDFIALHHLIKRNKERQLHSTVKRESASISPSSSSSSERIYMPFLITRCPVESALNYDDLSGGDKTEMIVECTHPFRYYKHSQILSEMGLARITPYELRRLIPLEITSFYPHEQLITDTPYTGTHTPTLTKPRSDVTTKAEDEKKKEGQVLVNGVTTEATNQSNTAAAT